ncbi:MAG: hypothetical protein ACE5LA_04860 [Dehalococcoidales bacterium]
MWVIISLASLTVILILVLCVPLDVVLQADVYGRPKFRLRLSWLFGLVSKEITKRKKLEEKRAVKEKQKLRDRRKGVRVIFEILRTRGLLGQLRRFLTDLLSRLRIRELGADFSMGLDNPADAGLLFALIGPAIPFLGSSRFHEIRLEPSSENGALLEGYSYGVARVRPIQLVTPLLRFAFSLATIRVLKKLVLTKWKRKK